LPYFYYISKNNKNHNKYSGQVRYLRQCKSGYRSALERGKKSKTFLAQGADEPIELTSSLAMIFAFGDKKSCRVGSAFAGKLRDGFISAGSSVFT
jgi:hypothetical protein